MNNFSSSTTSSSSSSIVLLLLGISSKVRDACSAVTSHDPETARTCLKDAQSAFSTIPTTGMFIDFGPLRSDLIRLYNASRAVGATESRASAAILLTASCRGNASAAAEAIACTSRTVSCLEKESKIEIATRVADAAISAHTLSGNIDQLLFGVELELYMTSMYEIYLFKVRVLDDVYKTRPSEDVAKALREILTLRIPPLIEFLPHERRTFQLSLFERGRVLLEACNYPESEAWLNSALALCIDETPSQKDSNKELRQHLLLTLACCASQRLDEPGSEGVAALSRSTKYLNESGSQDSLMGQLVLMKLRCKSGQLDAAMVHVQAMISLAAGKPSTATLGLVASALRSLAVSRKFDAPSMKIYASAVSNCYPNAPESVLIRFDLVASLILSLKANGVTCDDALKDPRASFLLQQILESHSKDKLPLPVLKSVLSFLDAGMRMAFEASKWSHALEIAKKLIELSQSLDPLSIPLPLSDLYKVCSQCCLNLGLAEDSVYTAKKAQELDDCASTRFLVLYTLCRSSTVSSTAVSSSIDNDLDSALSALMNAKDFQQRHLIAAFEELAAAGEAKPSTKRLSLARNALRFLIDSTCLSGYDVSTVHPSLNAFALVRLLIGVDRDCRLAEAAESSSSSSSSSSSKHLKETNLEALKSTVAILVIAGKCKEANSRISEGSREDLVWCLQCAWSASLALRGVGSHSSCIDAATAFNTLSRAFFLSQSGRGGGGGGRRQRGAVMLDMAASVLQAASFLSLGDDMKGVSSTSHLEMTPSRSFYERALAIISHCSSCHGEMQTLVAIGEEAPPEVKEVISQSKALLCELLKEAGGMDKPSSGGTDSLLLFLELHARARLYEPKAAAAAAAMKKLDVLLDSLFASKGVSTVILMQTSEILRQPPSSSRELAYKSLSHAIELEASLLLTKKKSDNRLDLSVMIAESDDVVESDTCNKSVDMELLSSLLRRLLLLSQTKLDSLVVFKRALRIAQQSLIHNEHPYPREEADWMAVTAWNTGVFFCRMGAQARGEPFLTFAVDEMAPVLQRLCIDNEEFSETLSNLPSMKAQLTSVRDELINPATTPTAISASMFSTPNLQNLLGAPQHAKGNAPPAIAAKQQQRSPNTLSSLLSSKPTHSAPPLLGESVRPLYFDAEVEEVMTIVKPVVQEEEDINNMKMT
jgi:hypothetical protein